MTKPSHERCLLAAYARLLKKCWPARTLNGFFFFFNIYTRASRGCRRKSSAVLLYYYYYYLSRKKYIIILLRLMMRCNYNITTNMIAIKYIVLQSKRTYLGTDWSRYRFAVRPASSRNPNRSLLSHRQTITAPSTSLRCRPDVNRSVGPANTPSF